MPHDGLALGKALNDPVKGVSALAKVGVTFTEGQKTSIAAMVKHGETAKAQQVILAELHKRHTDVGWQPGSLFDQPASTVSAGA